ncbi:DUF6160 family protein [Allohahella marinimesophila]|uniref:DUF6160 family protein n=1 Tax=Allohahella marinimesophila TaxID=1054972 RepID=UPI0031DCB3A1
MVHSAKYQSQLCSGSSAKSSLPLTCVRFGGTARAALGFGLLLSALSVQADLKPIDDAAMSEVTGQAAPVINMSGQITYEAIVYTDAQGNKETIRQGESSTTGAVQPYDRAIKGITFANQTTGTLMDVMSFVMPLRYGAVDIDEDGILDRGAAIFSFAPSIGMGTGALPIDIKAEDVTTVINDQVFVTNQGIVFLNAPAGGDGAFTVPGYDASLAPVPVKHFQ